MNSATKCPSISPDSIVVTSSDLVSATLDGGVVILGFKSGSYYGLDQVGMFVWNLLHEPRTVSAVRDAILDEYEVDPARCEADLLVLLEELASRQLIDVTNDRAT